jgi:hypothetical protein
MLRLTQFCMTVGAERNASRAHDTYRAAAVAGFAIERWLARYHLEKPCRTHGHRSSIPKATAA